MAPPMGGVSRLALWLLVWSICYATCSTFGSPINNKDNDGGHQHPYEWPMAGYATPLDEAPHNRKSPADKLTTTTNDNKRVVCYYHNVAVRRPDKGQLSPNQIDPLLCTHLIYSHLILSEYGEVKSHDKELDFGHNGGLAKFASLKRDNAELKILISIDDTSLRFSKAAASLESRARFIESAMALVEEYKFDGIDLAWKYPNDHLGRPSDKRNYILLVRELSLALKPKGYLLSAPVSIAKRRIELGYDVVQMAKYLDMIHLLAFDYNGGWDNSTGLHAPLYRSMRNDPRRLQVSADDTSLRAHEDIDSTLNVDWSVNHWLQLGAPAAKLNLGIAAYGRNFRLANEKQFGLKAPTLGSATPGPHLNDTMILGYNEICASFQERPNRWTVIRVPESEMPYAHRDLDWVSYEDRESVTVKANYAGSVKSLGGVAIISIDMDDFRGACHNRERFPLVKAIRRELKQSISTENVSTTESSIRSITPELEVTQALVSYQYSTTTTTTTKKDVPRNQPITESPNSQPAISTTTTESPNSSGKPPAKKSIICYYNNEASRRSVRGRLNLNKVNASLCTHLVYAHLGLSEGDLKIKSLAENEADSDNWSAQLISLKDKNPSLNIMVALGGESEDSLKYSHLAADPKSRSTFSKNVREFLEKHKLDGFSFDWEWPEASDKANYVSLLANLREVLPAPSKVLMVTAPTAKETIESGFDVVKLAQLVDFINLKSFEFAMGKGRIRTRAHAPLYSSKFDETSKERQQNVNWTVQYLINLGAPVEKLSLGVGLAGDSYTLTSSNDNGLNMDATLGPAAPHTQSAGFWSYQEICKAFKEQKDSWTIVRDSDCQCTYAYNGVKWLAYDSLDEIQLKAKYAKSKRLGGVTLYSLDLDDFSGQCHQEKFPLVMEVRRQLEHGEHPKQPTSVAPTSPTPVEPSSTTTAEVSSTTTSTTTQRRTTTSPTLAAAETTTTTRRASTIPRRKTSSTTITTTTEPTETTAETTTITTNLATTTTAETTTTTTTDEDEPDCKTEARFWFPGSDCGEYYDCTSGKAMLRRCQKGMVWKQQMLWCDYPHNSPRVTCNPFADSGSAPKAIDN